MLVYLRSSRASQSQCCILPKVTAALNELGIHVRTAMSTRVTRFLALMARYLAFCADLLACRSR